VAEEGDSVRSPVGLPCLESPCFIISARTIGKTKPKPEIYHPWAAGGGKQLY